MVQFILQRTGEAGSAPNVSDMSVTGGGVDPFTGGGARDTPMSRPQQPAMQTGAFSVTGGGVDPFTGGGGGGGSSGEGAIREWGGKVV